MCNSNKFCGRNSISSSVTRDTSLEYFENISNLERNLGEVCKKLTVYKKLGYYFVI